METRCSSLVVQAIRWMWGTRSTRGGESTILKEVEKNWDSKSLQMLWKCSPLPKRMFRSAIAYSHWQSQCWVHDQLDMASSLPQVPSAGGSNSLFYLLPGWKRWRLISRRRQLLFIFGALLLLSRGQRHFRGGIVWMYAQSAYTILLVNGDNVELARSAAERLAPVDA
jgi:hypothetical protein